MPLDVAAEAGFFAPLLGQVVLLSLGNQPVVSRMVDALFTGPLMLSARVQLLENLASGFFAVAAFGVILRPLLMSVAVLHQSSEYEIAR